LKQNRPESEVCFNYGMTEECPPLPTDEPTSTEAPTEDDLEASPEQPDFPQQTAEQPTGESILAERSTDAAEAPASCPCPCVRPDNPDRLGVWGYRRNGELKCFSLGAAENQLENRPESEVCFNFDL